MNSFTSKNHPTPEMLAAFHDGQIALQVELEAIAAHVGGCASCAAELRRLSAMSDLLAGYQPAISQIGRARLHQQIDNILSGNLDSSLIRFGLRISGIAASILLIGSIWLLAGGKTEVATQAAPPWVGMAVSSDADTVVQNAATPAAAVYLADASSSSDTN